MTAKKKIILIAASILLIVAVFIIAIGHSTWQRIAATGGIKTVLEQALRDDAAGINVSIENTEIAIAFSPAPFRLIANNIQLTTDDASFNLSSFELGFSIYNILTGNLTPSDLVISGLEIETTHQQKGKNTKNWQGGKAATLITSLLQGGFDTADNTEVFAIRNIYIDDARLTIKRQLSSTEGTVEDGKPISITLAPIGISMRYQDGVNDGNISINNILGGSVDVDFSSNKNTGAAQFSANLTNINMTDIYPYLGINVPEISAIGLLNGRAVLSVMDGQVTALSGDVIAGKGKTVLPSIGAVSFNNASIAFNYDAAADLLTVSNFDMITLNTTSSLVGGRVNFTGQLRRPLSDKPLVIAKLRGTGLAFQRLMGIWPKNANNQLRSTIAEMLQGGRVASLGLDIVGVLHRNDGLFNITTFDLVADLQDIALNARVASIRALRGSLGAKLKLSVGSKGHIEHASADFLLLDARLETQDRAGVVQLEGIEFRVNLEGNVINVTRGAIDARKFGQMAMVAKIELAQDWHPRRLDLSIKAEQIDKQLFNDLWPKDIQQQTREWVSGHIHGGQVNGLSLNASFDIKRDMPTEVIYLNGEARLVNAALTFLEGVPPIIGVNAPISFDDGFLRADIDSGMIDGVDVSRSRVIIRNDETGPVADVALLAHGDFGGVIRVLDHPRLNLIKKTGMTLTDVTGNIDTTTSLKWTIPQGEETISDVGGIDINLVASVANARMKGLPLGLELTDANLDMLMSNNRLNITGQGNFDKAAGIIDVTYSDEDFLDVVLNFPPSAELTAVMGDKSGLNLLGAAGGVINIVNPAGVNTANVVMDFDLTDTGINIDRFGLTKLPSEAARMIAEFTLVDGRFQRVNTLNIISDVLSVYGSLSFDEDGAFKGAYFDRVAWPGNDISEILVNVNAENVININAIAHVIDLTPLRREESPGEGVSLLIDLTANRIILDDKVSLAGNVVLSTEEDGTGHATFLGTLILNNKPFMKEATLKAVFGDGQDLMDGRGLIGDVEAGISLTPSRGGGNMLVLKSNNAGQVLKTMGVLDNIRGGKLNMVADFRPNNEPSDALNSMVNFEIEDFRIIEAPTAVRILSVLSVSGLYSLLEGDGTHFDIGHAEIEIIDGKQIIHSARATGNALAVDLVGVVNKNNSTLEVSGALLPIYGITKLLDNIPLVSEILTGVDNSGLLVTQFTISGSIDDPLNNVNLSSVIPGVFRDAFSPNWINNERARLITDNASPRQ